MKRTAADFAREAPEDGPFELDIDTGKTVKTVRPLPGSDLTYEQNKEVGRISEAWARAYNDALQNGKSAPPTLPGGAVELEPVEFRIRARFGALKARAEKDITAEDPRTFEAADNADYLAFRDHVWRPLPWAQVDRILDAVDEHYDPTPADATEKADAAGDLDGETAGKSGGDATS